MENWNFINQEQKEVFSKEITADNFSHQVLLLRTLAGLVPRDFAQAIGTSLPTISRLIERKTKPTKEMIERINAVKSIGIKQFSKLTEGEKDSATEQLIAAGSSTVGVAGALGAVSIAGTVGGLSAPGITSGLAALGGLLGGSMVTGIAVVAAIPILAGLGGYGLFKGVKNLNKQYEIDKGLDCLEINTKWESSID